MSFPLGDPNILNPEDDDDDSDDESYVPSSAGSSPEPSGSESDTDLPEGRKRKASEHLDSDGDDDVLVRKNDEKKEKDHSDAVWKLFKSSVSKNESSPVKLNDTKSETKAKEVSPSENVNCCITSEKIMGSSSTPSGSSSTNGKNVPSVANLVKSLPTKHATSQQKVPTKFTTPASSRLGSILSQIGQPKKKSILEQSREQWDQFKEKEGISDELASHNRGSKGYLERQDFLSRVDSRQAEEIRKMRLQLMNKRRFT